MAEMVERRAHLRAAAEIASKQRLRIERGLPACAGNFIATAILTGMIDAASAIEHDIHALAYKDAALSDPKEEGHG